MSAPHHILVPEMGLWGAPSEGGADCLRGEGQTDRLRLCFSVGEHGGCSPHAGSPTGQPQQLDVQQAQQEHFLLCPGKWTSGTQVVLGEENSARAGPVWAKLGPGDNSEAC